MLFRTFFANFKAIAILSWKSHLQYRLNFLADVLIQPLITAGVEWVLWRALFVSNQLKSLGDFPAESYYVYAILSGFFSRVGSNWMYEFRMIEEVESGNINQIMIRPMSFYSYYWSQFFTYKLMTILFSLWIPLAVAFTMGWPLHFSRLPWILMSMSLYLWLIYSLSFMMSLLAFKLTKVSSFTVAKNLALWLLSGELFPLDLLPSAVRDVFLQLPFCHAVYIPVAYLTGRIDTLLFYTATAKLVVWCLVFWWVSQKLWSYMVKDYTGTAA
jgi:ABC-2 type transport system permease protein